MGKGATVAGKLKTWFNGRRLRTKVILTATAALVLILGIGSVANGSNRPSDASSNVQAIEPTPSPTPTVVVSEESTNEPIPFGRLTVNDPLRDVGQVVLSTPGIDGVKTSTFRVTSTNGVETSRELIEETITTAPVDEVTAICTRPVVVAQPVQPTCDPNYTGQCVPVASDVDCGGGSGNGPAYVNGIVTVVGSDIYDLDRDGDGQGCD